MTVLKFELEDAEPSFLVDSPRNSFFNPFVRGLKLKCMATDLALNLYGIYPNLQKIDATNAYWWPNRDQTALLA